MRSYISFLFLTLCSSMMDYSTNNINTDIVFGFEAEKTFHSEIIIEHHVLVRILSGEMRIVQAEQTYMFVAGDTFLLPRNLPAAVIKYPKDGRPYKAVSINLRPDRLQDYYMRHAIKSSKPYRPKIK